MLSINDLLRSVPETTTVIEGIARLVGVDSQNLAYLIRVDKFPLSGPFQVPMVELQTAIHAGTVLLDQEIKIELPPTIALLGSAGKERVKKAMDILTPLLLDDDVLFDPEYRARMFAERGKECGVHPRQIRRLYYRYLWGGQTELALAPQFAKCGGRGQRQKPGSKRRGPKAESNSTASLVPLPAVREQLEKGAKLFYLSGSHTLEEAFMKTKKKYFSKEGCIEWGGRITEILIPPEQLPSLGQFRHICNCLLQASGKTRINSRRIRQKPVEWNFQGRSRDKVLGPGSRFEIDATKVQIRLVSRYDRSKTLENPTLYVVIDVWSGAIVGYALSLYNASWALAAKALLNCFTDKQEVFDRLGLNCYSKDDWPCCHLPARLTVDRGEMISHKAGLVPEIGIKVEIMPPMCPQLKGKVEASIKDIKHGHSHRLPGRHPKFRQRRETDGTETAALTIQELERAIVEIIMGLNHEPAPASHIPPEMIEEGETELTRIGLYRWGIERFSQARTLTKEKAWESLMMKGEASLTPRGLNFKCQTFTSPALINAATNKRASGKGFPLVHVRYDEHQADRVWFMDLNTKTWVPAFNCNEDVRRRKAAYYDLEISLNELKELRRRAKDENLHRDGERSERIKSMVCRAEAEAKEDRKGISKAGRKKNRKKTTQIEKEAGTMIAAGATAPPLRGASKNLLLSDGSVKDDSAGIAQAATPTVPQVQSHKSTASTSLIAEIENCWESL